jgi:hypothetical protein
MDTASTNNKTTSERIAALEAVPCWTWEVDLEALWLESEKKS